MNLRSYLVVAAAAMLFVLPGGSRAAVPAPAERVLAPATKARTTNPQTQARLAALNKQHVQGILDRELTKNLTRLDSLKGQIQQKKVNAPVAAKRALDAGTAACLTGPQIFEVTPLTIMPGDPVVVTGCGFTGSTGMLLLSDGNRQMAITSWSDAAIEATVPKITGFADPKSVTLKVVTVDATKTAPSPPLTLKPSLVLQEILPAGVSLSGCGDSFVYGIVSHPVSPGEGQACGQGTDTVKFGYQLTNNWTFHSVVFDTLCTQSLTPCGGANHAAADTSVYQLGKSLIPDMKVTWQGYVSYYPSIMAVGPEGTPPK
jgi:hypothetical protein